MLFHPTISSGDTMYSATTVLTTGAGPEFRRNYLFLTSVYCPCGRPHLAGELSMPLRRKRSMTDMTDRETGKWGDRRQFRNGPSCFMELSLF